MKVTPDRLAVAREVRDVCRHVAIIHQGKLATDDVPMLDDHDLRTIIARVPDENHDCQWRRDADARVPDENHDCQWRRDTDARAEDKVLHLSAEPLPAPTGPGWWFARRKNRRDWEPVLYVHDGNQEEPEAYVVCIGEEEGRDVSEFAMDVWLPLVAPTAKGGAE